MKQVALEQGCELEVLLFDSESNANVQKTISEFRSDIDVLEIKKDKGQFDAINKGIQQCSGEYWTWLNTDDLLEEEGFRKVIQHLKQNREVDYIYGSIQYMDAENKNGKVVNAWPLHLEELVSSRPSVFQPGSWFRKGFSNSLGLLAEYQCCFDYEYICRTLKKRAKIYCLDAVVARFRYYPDSKSGSIMKKFVQEQWEISRAFGRKWWNSLTWMLALRKLKHFVFS